MALWHTCRSISLPDILDMAVVSCLIYAVLLWFEWTKAAFVARGILILAVLYILARQMGMVLTTWIFHGFFAIFVIAVVIIFQEEIRRFFERLALWSWRRGPPIPFRSEMRETLVQSVSLFSHSHLGALIVLRGKDLLERHTEGGFDLDGKLSGALLQSIFDVHSEGHDGAVIIENGRVRQFGVHLPLSKNLARLAGVGTRHAAALGLSEVTDALCLVVSEQRGTISVARHGQLTVIQNLNDLEILLQQFTSRQSESDRIPLWETIFIKNKTEKILAVGLSLMLWLVFVQGFKPDEQSYSVPVTAQNIPSGLRLQAISPHKVLVTFSGLKRDLDLVPAQELHAFINLEGRSPGTERVMISDDNIRTPEALHFRNAEPPEVEVALTPITEMEKH